MDNFFAVEKAAGTLLGMTVGNTLGASVDGKTAQEIQDLVGTVDRFRESFDLDAFALESPDLDEREKEFRILRWVPSGVYTSDVQQALALCDCLIRDQDIIGDRVADFFCRLAQPEGHNFRFGIFRGAGRSFRDSIHALKDGEDWRLSGQDSASNGAAMRVAPLGIFFRDDLDKLKQRVIDQSGLTHRNAMAIAAAQAVAHTIALLLPKRTLEEPKELLAKLVQHVQQAEDLAADQDGDIVTDLEENQHTFSQALEKLCQTFDLSLEDGLARIGQEAEAASQREGIGATGGYVLSSVIGSFLVFLKSAGTYERPVQASVNLGGDTDTVGAMVGSMAGALHGVYAIPARWLRGLKNAEQIEMRARALVDNDGWPQKLRSLYDLEETIRLQINKRRDKYLPQQRTDDRRRPGRGPRRESRGRHGGRSSRRNDRRD